MSLWKSYSKHIAFGNDDGGGGKYDLWGLDEIN